MILVTRKLEDLYYSGPVWNLCFCAQDCAHNDFFVHQAVLIKGVALCRKAWSVLIGGSEVPHIDYTIY